jgi:hypothetical protein
LHNEAKGWNSGYVLMRGCLIQLRKFHFERSAEQPVKCGRNVIGNRFVQGNHGAGILVGKPARGTKIAAMN